MFYVVIRTEITTEIDVHSNSDLAHSSLINKIHYIIVKMQSIFYVLIEFVRFL